MKKIDNTSKYVALLTGTIDSSVFQNTGNKIQNIAERLKQYETSITRYITDSVFTTIVFAENSGHPFDSKKFEELATQYNKKFEYIKCPSYIEPTIKHGKSYGEARLIDDALKMSTLLKNHDCIYKLTGRIFLQNSQTICNTCNKFKNEFLVYNTKRWCFTNIFKFSKSDYMHYWKNVFEKCDEPSRHDIEFVFYDTIESATKTGLEVGSFSVWPYFDGIQGATLEPYSGRLYERVGRNLLCKLHAFYYRN